jgi:hypothetical protein
MTESPVQCAPEDVPPVSDTTREHEVQLEDYIISLV